jgi:hypothetical protein
MQPRRADLRMYGQPSDHEPLSWDWVAGQLAGAGLYWVTAQSPGGHPHPRPVWGVWVDDELQLSIGSPAIRDALAADPLVTVHLESATDVVIIEGRFEPRAETPAALIEAYQRKYDWDYDQASYGPFSPIVPLKVIAWRTAGFAGSESFQTTGRWDFESAHELPTDPHVREHDVWLTS